jgi:hypothetical protein
MAENRTNIAWYLPKAYAAKLLPIFQEIDQWYYKQAQLEATKDGPQTSQTNAQHEGVCVVSKHSAAPSVGGGKPK